MKRALSCLLILVMLLSTLTACGKKETKEQTGADTNTTENTSGSDSEASSVEKEKIIFWYSKTGNEGEYYAQAAKDFNASQDKYEVEALSVTDKQKYIVAIASDECPDVIEVSNQDIISYAGSGLIDPVDSIAEKDGYALEGVYANQALEANTLEEAVYGVPLTSVVIQMFYNKDILEELGYSEPPKTMEELYEMAAKATQVDDNGTITRLGYPLFPLASARQELIYAFGGTWWDKDGVTLTPDNEKILDSLNMNIKYRELYGTEKVQE